MDESTDERLNDRTNKGTDGRTDKHKTDRRTDRQIDGRSRPTDGSMHKQMDSLTDRRRVRWTDGRTANGTTSLWFWLLDLAVRGSPKKVITF